LDKEGIGGKWWRIYYIKYYFIFLSRLGELVGF
jgi:hypothetical protein